VTGDAAQAPRDGAAAPGGWPVFIAVHAVIFLALTGLLFAVQSRLPWSEFGVARVLEVLWRTGWSPELARSAWLAALLTGGLALSTRRSGERSTLYGDARFATLREMKKAYLLEPSGVMLGCTQPQGPLLRNNQALHICFVAPPGATKTAGVVKPNLLSWQGSAIALDVKHEVYRDTSGWRSAALGQQVFMWSPADNHGRSHGYNPLDEVRTEPHHRVTDLQRLAAILMPTPEKAEPMWSAEARDLFVGLALWVLESEGIPHTIGEIYRIAKSEAGLDELVDDLLKARTDFPSQGCRLSLASFARKAERERSGVRSHVTGALALWSNPLIDAATSRSDFSLRDLRKKPMTIYVGVSLDNLVALSPLLTLFFEQAIAILTRAVPGKDEPLPVLAVLDEFAALRKMDILVNALAQLRQYRVRVAIIVQGLSQLDQHYGRAGRESLLQTTALQLFSAPNDDTTAEYLSGRLGKTTIRTVSRSHGHGWGSGSRSYAYAQRDLMLTDETRRIPPEQLVILKEGARPVLGYKLRYFDDPLFANRLLPAPEVPNLDLSAPATRSLAAKKKARQPKPLTPEEQRRAWRRRAARVVEDGVLLRAVEDVAQRGQVESIEPQ
jgi:type IV secretion system protein VirD4